MQRITIPTNEDTKPVSKTGPDALQTDGNHVAPSRDTGASWLRGTFRAITTVVLIALIYAGAKALQSYLIETRPNPPTVETKERARAVQMVTAKVADIQPTLRVYGQIGAGRSVDLRMLVSGEVLNVSPNFVEGGRVAKDEALVTVDSFEYDGVLVRTRAELTEAELNIKETEARIELEKAAQVRAVEQQVIAQRDVERFTTLLKRKAVSESALDASRNRKSAADAAVEQRANQTLVLEAQLARQRASLDRLKWNVRRAERDLRNTVLKAPFEGVLSNVAAEAGRLLNVSDRVATLIDLDRFEVRFTLTDAQYGRLIEDGGKLTGRPATAVWEGGGARLEANGVIDRVSPVVSSAAGGFDVFARLERSKATEVMRPGAFVAVLTRDTQYRDVIRLPETALHPGNKVFAISDAKRLVEIPVTVAGYDDNAVLVRGDISDGMPIMTSRLPDAAAGILVTLPDNAAANAGSTP